MATKVKQVLVAVAELQPCTLSEIAAVLPDMEKTMIASYLSTAKKRGMVTRDHGLWTIIEQPEPEPEPPPPPSERDLEREAAIAENVSPLFYGKAKISKSASRDLVRAHEREQRVRNISVLEQQLHKMDPITAQRARATIENLRSQL